MMNKIKNISTFFCAILIVTYIIHIALIYKTLPESLPIHFNFAGNPDGFGDRISVIFEPLISALVVIIVEIISHFPQLWNYPVKVTDENRDILYAITMVMISIIKAFVTIILLYAGLCSIYSFLPISLIYVFVTLLFVVIISSILIMIKAR